MSNYTVNVPIWEIYYVEAETPKEALEKAMLKAGPDDSWGMDNVSTEVNLDVGSLNWPLC